MTIQHNENHILPKLKILGVGSLKTRALKANLIAALDILRLEIPLEEVEGVDELMQYDISGIPAVIVDEDILIQKQVPTVEVLVTLLAPFFEKKNEIGVE